MKICNLSDGLGQLAHAVADFDQRWVEAQVNWNDETSRDFEQTHLAQIPGQVQMLTAAVQALAASADKAARELDYRSEEW